jgi:hypothetical protein
VSIASRKQQRGVKMRRYQRDQRDMAGRVPCGKVAYVSKHGAKAAIKLHGQFERAYRCEHCGNWHLTSKRKAR